MIEPESELLCSFCGRSSDGGRRLVVADGGAAICDECLRVATQIVATERTDAAGDEDDPAPSDPDS